MISQSLSQFIKLGDRIFLWDRKDVSYTIEDSRSSLPLRREEVDWIYQVAPGIFLYQIHITPTGQWRWRWEITVLYAHRV